jgi:nitrite reductase/ring-hydroxylating ferredoxin subunit
MSSKWRRFEVLLPLQFNDGCEIPGDWLADAVLEVVEHFGAASYETQKVEGHFFESMLMERVRLCSIADVPPGTGREVVAAGRIIAVFNVDGQFYALDGICPHAGGPLGQGSLAGGVVTCPWHGWQFDVTSGRHCLNPRLTQAAYPVEIEAGDVFVVLP